MGKKVIKLFFGNGYANCDHMDYVELPDNWEDMTDLQKTSYLDTEASTFMENYAEYSATVVDTEEDSEYQPNWYSA